MTIRRAVLLMGPRRVGKTVLLRHVVQRLIDSGVPPRRVCYVSVDHPLYNGLGLEQLLDSFRDAAGVDPADGPLYVLFDEIQHLREWEVHLKSLVDTHADVRLVASGSAAAALKPKSRESGAGRFTEFLLPPLTFHEYVDLRGRTDALFYIQPEGVRAKAVDDVNREFVEYLNFGGYPELALNPLAQKDPSRFVKEDVIDKVLLRDLPGLYGIQDVQELNSLFTMLAFNTGSEVSLEALSQRSHVAKNTLKRYIEYLEAAFLIKVVHRVDHSARRFQRASAFKVYLTNPAMFSALFTPVGADDPVTPRLVETAVFSQWLHSPELVHYARWDSGEVDLVWLDALQRPTNALEVKWTDRAFDDPSEVKPLIAFCLKHGVPRPMVATRTATGVKTVGGLTVGYLPASVYSFVISRELVSRRNEAVHAAVREIAQTQSSRQEGT
ncbi:MAG: ATP-binding protein [Vicinamibacterales bacterium]